MPEPTPFDYIDLPTFVSDWITWQDRRRRTGYSQRQFAKKSGLSPSMLSQVIKGQRTPSVEATHKLAHGMGLSGQAEVFLQKLAALDRAPTVDDYRRIASEMWLDQRCRRSTKLDTEGDSPLAKWLVLVVRGLASLPDFECDPRWIQQRLRRPASTEEIQAAIELLFELGAIRREGDSVVATHAMMTSDGRGTAAMDFHREHLMMAFRAIEGVPTVDRVVGSGLVLIPTQHVDYALDEFDRLAGRFVSEIEAVREKLNTVETGPVDAELFQLGIQLFPITQSMN